MGHRLLAHLSQCALCAVQPISGNPEWEEYEQRELVVGPWPALASSPADMPQQTGTLPEPVTSASSAQAVASPPPNSAATAASTEPTAAKIAAPPEAKTRAAKAPPSVPASELADPFNPQLLVSDKVRASRSVRHGPRFIVAAARRCWTRSSPSSERRSGRPAATSPSTSRSGRYRCKPAQICSYKTSRCALKRARRHEVP